MAIDVAGFFLEKVAIPVATGAGGVLTTIWRLQKALSDRVRALESAWSQFSTKDYPREQKSLTDALANLKKDLDDEVDGIFAELKARSRERADSRRLQSRLSERYMALQQRLEECEKSVAELNDQFQDYAKGQNDQWQTMTRTLGQLEGYLRGIFRGTGASGQFPETKPPR